MLLSNDSVQEEWIIPVAARVSLLSQAQVKEVFKELKRYRSKFRFETYFVETKGDKDQTTSLRGLDRTDFFTQEVDDLLLQGKCRIAIHSAKDLPAEIPKGLKIISITHGLDSSDSLVLRPGETLQSLKKNAMIATSSVRREEAVRSLRSDFTFCDLRGTINQRLKLLEIGKADGVVVAEAALIRLGYKHLNRIKLPGETTPLQGKLAILAREDDEEMERFFACLDSR